MHHKQSVAPTHQRQRGDGLQRHEIWYKQAAACWYAALRLRLSDPGCAYSRCCAMYGDITADVVWAMRLDRGLR